METKGCYLPEGSVGMETKGYYRNQRLIYQKVRLAWKPKVTMETKGYYLPEGSVSMETNAPHRKRWKSWLTSMCLV